MQDVHPISTGVNGGGTGTLFGDRRLRPHSHHPNNQQALKCPRCDSSNTKFCYYNNYNLSQPRHFCKNCRRYWTKGGVLRNVPVGGGCRKSKRSNKSKPKPASKLPYSRSSSESSNGATTTVNNTSNTASATTTVNSKGGVIYQISETENNFGLRNLNTTTNQIGDGGNSGTLFPKGIGGFMSLMNNNNNISSSGDHNNQLCYDDGTTTASFSQFLQSQSGVHDWDLGKLGGTHEADDEKMGGMLDATVRIDDLLENRGTLDWHQTTENEHHGLFDLPSTVDHQPYWSQSTVTTHHHTHWSDNTNDHSLFLP